MMAFIIFFLVVLSQTEAKVDSLHTQLSRPNYGVFFLSQGIFDNSNSVWYHDFKIDRMQPVPPPPKIVICDLDYLRTNATLHVHVLVQQMCNMYDGLIQISAKQTITLYKEINSNINSINVLLLQSAAAQDDILTESNFRNKRSPFDFVGSALSSLFGTVTQDQLHEFHERVTILDQKIDSNTFQHNALKKELLSYIQLASKRYQWMSDRVLLNYNNTLILQESLKHMLKNYNRLSERIDVSVLSHSTIVYNILSSMVQQVQTLSIIRDITSERLAATELLIQNRLSPKLIRPKQLKKAFTAIKRILLHNYPRFTISNDDPSFLYHVPNIYHYSTSKHLYVRITIPLTSYNSLFRVYRTHHLPIPLPNKNATEMTRIENISPYIAISDDLQFYIEMTTEFYETCQGEGIQYCTETLPVIDAHILTCTAALFFDDPVQAHQACLLPS